MGMSRLISQLFFGVFFLMEIPYAGLNHELILRLRQVDSNVSAYTHKLSLLHSQSQSTPTYWRVCHNFVLVIFPLPVPVTNYPSHRVCLTGLLLLTIVCFLLLYTFLLRLNCIIFCFLRGFCAHANFECLRVLSGCDCFSKCFLNEALATLNKIN